MKELIIHEFEAKHIEDTLRMVSNHLQCNTEETCMDRQVVKAKKMIDEILKRTPQNNTKTKV